MLIKRKHIVTVGIVYWIPDYCNLLQEFYWQVDDEVPGIPRVHLFLNYWKNNIDAVIKEVLVAHAENSDWRRIV